MTPSTHLLSEAVFLKVNAVAEKARAEEKNTIAQKAKADYGNLALQIPMLIRRNGLIQALLFAQHQARPNQDENGSISGHRQFFLDFCLLRLPDNALVPTLVSFVPEDSADAVVKAIDDLSWKPDYIHVTRFALRQAEWFKRFAQSVLEIEKPSATDTEARES